MDKLSRKEANEILKRVHLPVSSNRATILAYDTKSARQSIILDAEHDDREIAAAIEIQRVWRGYSLRCKLYDALYPSISLETQAQSSQHKLWSETISDKSFLHSSHSQGTHVLVNEAQSTPAITEQTQPEDTAKSNARLKLEKNYARYLQMHKFISFEDYCALYIQSWWHQVCEEQRNIRVPSVRPPTMNESYSSGRSTHVSYQRSAVSSPASGVLTRKTAARIIQKAWRRHIDMQVYQYYRDLISFKFRGDPALLLRCINPKEAELLDSASGTHVKFRLAGSKFPPNIYYKIFTHRPVVDLCANSPKDYTKASAKQLVARQCHNKQQPIYKEDGKDGWYQRWENNGWRVVSDRILRRIDEDALLYDSAQKKMEFKHSKLLRKQDLERKRKMKKIQWMKKMYRDGMLWTRQGTESAVERDIENTVKGMVEMTDKLGHGAVEEWEVDELLEWTNGLNFDHYVSEWKECATSATSDHLAEKPQFFAKDRLPLTFT